MNFFRYYWKNLSAPNFLFIWRKYPKRVQPTCALCSTKQPETIFVVKNSQNLLLYDISGICSLVGRVKSTLESLYLRSQVVCHELCSEEIKLRQRSIAVWSCIHFDIKKNLTAINKYRIDFLKQLISNNSASKYNCRKISINCLRILNISSISRLWTIYTSIRKCECISKNGVF